MRRVFLLFIALSALALYGSESGWGDTPNKLDPVYQLSVDKYPKFQAEMVLKNGKKIRFCCVKSMLHFFFSPYRYPEYGVKDSGQIDRMYVKDYLDGSSIDAKKAWYVFGSRLVGPHGDDLIPLSSKTRAELFVKRYGGTRVMEFGKLSAGLVRYLDM
jgi:nitrous oxide reductase accessory protein NosL